MGVGTPLREFMHVDDCADALVFLMRRYSAPEHINVGTGQETTIIDLARLLSEVIGYRGSDFHDLSKPDGTPRKLMNSTNLRSLGWSPRVDLRDGLDATYRWYLSGTSQV